MDSLIEHCNNLNLASDTPYWYNNSSYSLYVTYSEMSATDHVHTSTTIFEGQFIGYIKGTQIYTWDIPAVPNKYCFIINDSIAIDCNEMPRCITSMICKGANYNCKLEYVFIDESIDGYVIADRHSYSGDELSINDKYLEIYI